MTCHKRLIAVGVVLALGLLGPASAFAAKPTHETIISPLVEYPAGLVCEGFPVALSEQTVRITTFFDRDGNPVRILGRGASTATATNVDTGRSIPFSHGAAAGITSNPDGSQTQVFTGHLLVGLFPTDVPAGPSLNLYTGRTVLRVQPDGSTTLVSTTDKSPVDMCAALSD